MKVLIDSFKASNSPIFFVAKLLAFFFSLLIFIYIFGAHLYRLITPSAEAINPKVFDLFYLRYIFSAAFALGMLGWFISFLQKESKLASIWNLSIEEKIIYLVMSVALAFFYHGIIPLFGISSYLSLAVLIFIFFISLPQLINFYSNQKIPKIRKDNAFFNFPKFSKLAKDSFNTNMILISIITLLTVLSLFIIKDIIGNILSGAGKKELELKKTVHIKRINPLDTTHAEKVTLSGYNFGYGSLSDRMYKLMTDYGEIRLIDYWDNEKIIFTVPLNIQVGERKVWIVKPVDHLDRKKGISKSNVVKLSVFSRFVLSPDIGDTIFTRVVKRIKKFLFFKVTVFNKLLFTSYE